MVVESHDALRDALIDLLRSQGHLVEGVGSAEALVDRVDAIDLVILELNLPGEDGLSLTNRLRQSHPNLGIIMVTERAMSEEKVQGYLHGADIYLTKPVSFDELKGAVHSLARRLQPAVHTDGLHLDIPRSLLSSVATPAVSLTAQQVALVTAFCRAPDRCLESWQIIELLAQQESQDPKAVIEVHLVRLRKKLAQAGAPTPSIRSIRGWGYQLCAAVTVWLDLPAKNGSPTVPSSSMAFAGKPAHVASVLKPSHPNRRSPTRPWVDSGQ